MNAPIVTSAGPPAPKQRLKKLWQAYRRGGYLAALDHFFWKTLCCRPDGGRLHSWWYGVTGHIARWFHQFHCQQCIEQRQRERTAG